MGLKSLLTTLALSAFALGINAQTGSLSFGDYDSVNEWDDYDESYGYESTHNSYFGACPMNFYANHSGSQTILTKEELKDLKGHNITSIGYKFYNIGEAYEDIYADIQVYLSETSLDNYEINNNGKKMYFDISNAKKVYDGTIYYDAMTYMWTFFDETILKFKDNDAFYYSGNNNLVVTIIANMDNPTGGGFYIDTWYADELENRSLTYFDNKKTFKDYLEETKVLPTSACQIYGPMMAIGYESATAPDATYKTFVTSCDVDFTAIKGIEAYKVASVGSNSLQLEAIESAKAGTPVILKTNIQPSFTTGTATAVSDNMLQASDGTVTSDGTFYCLATKNGVQAFYPVTSGVKIPKGKAYVQIAGGAAKMNIALDDVTAISTATTTQKSDAVYNLQGQRTEAAKGIFIVGGKKVIKK